MPFNKIWRGCLFSLFVSVGFQGYLLAMQDYNQRSILDGCPLNCWIAFDDQISPTESMRQNCSFEDPEAYKANPILRLRKMAQDGLFEEDAYKAVERILTDALQYGDLAQQQALFELAKDLHEFPGYYSQENEQFSIFLLTGLQDRGVVQVKRQVQQYVLLQNLLFLKYEVQKGSLSEDAYDVLSQGVISSDVHSQCECFDILTLILEHFPELRNQAGELLDTLKKHSRPEVYRRIQQYTLLQLSQFLKSLKNEALTDSGGIDDEKIENLRVAANSHNKEIQIECLDVITIVLERLALIEEEHRESQTEIQAIRKVLFTLLETLQKQGCQKVREQIQQVFFDFHALSQAKKMEILQPLKDELQSGDILLTEDGFLQIKDFLAQAVTSIDIQIQQICLEILTLFLSASGYPDEEYYTILKQLLNRLTEHASEPIKNKIQELGFK